MLPYVSCLKSVTFLASSNTTCWLLLNKETINKNQNNEQSSYGCLWMFVDVYGCLWYYYYYSSYYYYYVYIYIWTYIWTYIYIYRTGSLDGLFWHLSADQRGHRGGQLPVGFDRWRHALQFDHQAEQRGPQGSVKHGASATGLWAKISGWYPLDHGDLLGKIRWFHGI